MNERHSNIYTRLVELGADVGAIEFKPYEYLRKCGFLATPESVDRLKSDLMVMEEDGWILIGARTAAGHMVMATNKMTEAVLLTFERMVAIHALMSDEERAMLGQWEKAYLGGPNQLATSEWPGWRVVFKRLAH